MVRPDKTPAFWSVCCPHRRRFRVFRGAIEKTFGVSLPFPSLAGDGEDKLSSFKRFCSAPLERRSNSWSDALERSRLSRDMRWSVYHSLFLFRKTLPSARPSAIDFMHKISSPSPPPDPLFMEFIRNEVPRIFPPGWDSAYSQKCLSVTVPTKACAENTLADGGSRSMVLDRSCGWEEARSDFIESVLTTTEPFLGDVPSRVSVVQSSGKWRVLSVPSVEMNRLRPLHQTIYDHISRQKWVLRGDAKAHSFREFVSKEGELFVSGDYESATDNLNSEVQKEILRLVLQSTKHVPRGVIVSAMRSFSLELTSPPKGPSLVVKQQSGQMMGNLLSFPLLCLVNYLTFRWLVMDTSVPVRINGDDIVFRCSREVANRWMKGVECSGLVLSKGKTLVDSRYFSLNSALFKGGGVVSAIPFIRSRALFGMEDCESPITSMVGRFVRFCPGFFGRRRTTLRSIFLRENSGWIRKSRRSLSRGLGMPVTGRDLAGAGLFAREVRYLSLPVEGPVPMKRSEWAQVTEGHEIVCGSRQEKERAGRSVALRQAFIESAWRPPRTVTAKEVNEEWCAGPDLSDSNGYSRSIRSRRLATLLKPFVFLWRPDLRGEVLPHYDDWDPSRVVRSLLRIDGSVWDRWLGSRSVSYRFFLPRDREVVMRSDTSSFPVARKSWTASPPLCDREETGYSEKPGLGRWSFVPPPASL